MLALKSVIVLVFVLVAKSVVYSPLSNCTDTCSIDLHQCTSCADYLDACPEGLTSSIPPALNLDPTTCYQTECSSGGCPEGEVEEPAHTPGELCFTSDLDKCHTGVCRLGPCTHAPMHPGSFTDIAFAVGRIHCFPLRIEDTQMV